MIKGIKKGYRKVKEEILVGKKLLYIFWMKEGKWRRSNRVERESFFLKGGLGKN